LATVNTIFLVSQGHNVKGKVEEEARQPDPRRGAESGTRWGQKCPTLTSARQGPSREGLIQRLRGKVEDKKITP
jgi:hypothetical protein